MRPASKILFLLIALSVSGCNKEDASVRPTTGPDFSYSYFSYDSLGTVIVHGWFTLDTTDSPRLSGEWHFTQVAGGSEIGPQVGHGYLAGEFDGEEMRVELNPASRDNNLQLIGRCSPVECSGTWTAVGLMGVYNHGTFRAWRLLEIF